MRRGVLVALLLLTACGGSEAATTPSTTTAPTATASTTTGPRLSAANRAALAALVAGSPATLDPEHLDHDVAGHDVWGPVAEPPLDAATAAELDAQWAAAVEAAEALATPADAVAAGYQKSAAELPGIGAHYVNWALIDRPFDPARPAMLLYDESEVRPTRLAGFSYWVRSTGVAPAGFAGDADHWHMHHGLCFVDGMLVGEGVTDPAGCAGDWLAGTDLWMGHAWVSPVVANPWGRFAPRNPALCPGPAEPTADFNRCPDPLPASPAGTGADGTGAVGANELLCVIPGPT